MRHFIIPTATFLFLNFIAATAFASPTLHSGDADTSYHSSDSWTFDAGPYSKNPKTGARVDQYAKPAPSYRNPNAWFESPGPSILDGSESQYQYNIAHPMGMYPYETPQNNYSGPGPAYDPEEKGDVPTDAPNQ